MLLTCMDSDGNLRAMEMQGQRRVKYLSARVDPDLHARFKAAARAKHRSVEGEVKNLMERRAREFEAEKEAA